jgi:NhaP-type Na+/H+ or K+/H+ antiporter
MSGFDTQAFVATLALIGVVVLVSALLSGVIERTGLPQVAVFLALGAMLGPAGLGLLHVTLDSPTLRVIATLSLALVLFTDAVSIDLNEVRRNRTLALLMVGPGTLLSAVVLAGVAWAILGLSPAAAALLGAALASTDPVLLRGLLRERRISSAIRQALKLESGFNDAILLPIVLVSMAFLGQGNIHGASGWAHLGVDLFLLGPPAGVLVGLVAVGVLDLVRRRVGIRRDYESLYSLGVALTSYAAAEAVHGSGFLAAFAAGVTISALDVELCDCFLEYGETTAEMALLLTFVLLGSSLIWDGFLALSVTTALFAVVALLVRVPVFLLALSPIRLAWQDRLLIAWFGPRGLSSLLLILLPVFAGLSGSRQLFEICCLVVLLSVVVHGGTPALIAQRARKRARHLPAATAAIAEAPVSPDAPPAPEAGSGGATPVPAVAPQHTRIPLPTLPAHSGGSDGAHGDGATVQGGDREPKAFAPLVADRERITVDELRHLYAIDAPVLIADARTERTRGRDNLQARGAVRIEPDHDAREQATAAHLSHEAWLVVYCA